MPSAPLHEDNCLRLLSAGQNQTRLHLSALTHTSMQMPPSLTQQWPCIRSELVIKKLQTQGFERNAPSPSHPKHSCCPRQLSWRAGRDAADANTQVMNLLPEQKSCSNVLNKSRKATTKEANHTINSFVLSISRPYLKPTAHRLYSKIEQNQQNWHATLLLLVRYIT